MNTKNTHEISLQNAIDMTTRYRANRPPDFPICETFGIDAVKKLLATDGCVSLRIYYGMKENQNVDAILVAANANGEDILPASASTPEPGNNSIILEDGFRCPEACPPPSPLNGK
jgi:hypothetical protein